MYPYIPLTLALDFSEVIGAAVVIVIVVISAVSNWLKKQAEEREARNRQLNRGRLGSQLDDLAARRREQLHRQASLREGHQQPQSSGDGAANNMSMADRIARARAKAQYENRSQQLRSSQQPVTSEQDRQRQTDQRRIQHQREETTRLRQQQQLQARREAELARQKAVEQARKRQQLKQKQVLPQVQVAQAEEHSLLHQMDNIHQLQSNQKALRPMPSQDWTHVKDGRHIATGTMPYLVNIGKLSSVNLRQAFIMKEILDQPVSLREPEGRTSGWTMI